MGDDANEFADAKFRDTPAGRGLGEGDDACVSGEVLGRLLAVRMNKNVGVDRNQSGASMRS